MIRLSIKGLLLLCIIQIFSSCSNISGVEGTYSINSEENVKLKLGDQNYSITKDGSLLFQGKYEIIDHNIFFHGWQGFEPCGLTDSSSIWIAQFQNGKISISPRSKDCLFTKE